MRCVGVFLLFDTWGDDNVFVFTVRCVCRGGWGVCGVRGYSELILRYVVYVCCIFRSRA